MLTPEETQKAIDNNEEPRPKAYLVGLDSNAFILIGHVSGALRRAGASKEHINAFMKEAMSGDYAHLLGVCGKFSEVS